MFNNLISILTKLLGFSLTIILVRFFAPYIPEAYKKLTFGLFKKLSSDEITYYKSVIKPKHYQAFEIGINILFLFLFILACFGGIVLTFRYIVPIQRYCFGKDALYFSSPFGFFAPVYMLIVAAVFFGLFCFLIYYLTPKPYLDVLTTDQIKGGFPYTFKTLGLIFCTIGVEILIITFPIFGLFFRDYKAVFNNQIIANRLLDVSNKTYTFNQIEKVTMKSYIRNSENVNIDFYFYFKDGRKVEFLQGSTLSHFNDTQFIVLYDLLRKNQVKVEIEKPSPKVVALFQNKFCPNAAITFNAAFEINYPIPPLPSGCAGINNTLYNFLFPYEER